MLGRSGFGTAASCRVAEKKDGQWVTNEWAKKAVLLSFRLEDNDGVDDGYTRYYDKVPSKFAGYDRAAFQQAGFRVVPPAAVRYGAYIAKNVVLMPSFVNIGGYVDEGTMVDTWATVGSCAQIGKNVHLSGGVGIGGVLEPLQASPTIIEDNCFIGAARRSSRASLSKRKRDLDGRLHQRQHQDLPSRHGEVLYGRVPARARSSSRVRCRARTAAAISIAPSL